MVRMRAPQVVVAAPFDAASGAAAASFDWQGIRNTRAAANVNTVLWRLVAFKVVVTVCIVGYAAAMIWLRLREAGLTADAPPTPSPPVTAGGGVVGSPAEGVAAFVHRLLFGADGDGLVVLIVKLWIVAIVLLLLAAVFVPDGRRWSPGMVPDGMGTLLSRHSSC